MITGWATTKPNDKWIGPHLENQKIMIFCPLTHDESDQVCFVTSDNLTYKCHFSIFNKKVERIKTNIKYADPRVSETNLRKLNYEDIK
jgi:hypothetical protein